MQSDSCETTPTGGTGEGPGEKGGAAAGNSGHTTGGGTHAVHRIIHGIELQIAGLHEIKRALEELNGKGRSEIIELIGSMST